MPGYSTNFKVYSEKIKASETSIVPVKKEALLKIALVFPNQYAVAISNLGFQEVFRLFNTHPAVVCERCFLYPPPLQNLPLTLESGRNLHEFDIIAFSVSFELDYPNLLQIIQNSQLELFAHQRDDRDPLIICGGVISMLNPLPLAPFIDVFLVGEAETLVGDFLSVMLQYKNQGLKSAACLDSLKQHPSFWVPNDSTGQKEKIIITRDRRAEPIQSSVISSQSHFKNMHLIEVGRACGRGCRFCAAGFVYRPIHFFPVATLLDRILNNSFQVKRAGLIGSALSDYPDLELLCGRLVENNFELGLSSFRLDAISTDFVNILEKGGVKSLTLAPEAGSQKLRNIIHKQLTEEQIFSAIQAISKSAIRSLKFYFMIGFPGEYPGDLDAIVQLMQKIVKIVRSDSKISLSINTFIPKPGTPFQWSPMTEEKLINQKRNYLINELKKIKRLEVGRKSAREEILQALFSAGNIEIGRLIAEYVTGKASWSQLLKANQELVTKLIFHPKDIKTAFPWDFLMTDEQRKTLWKNREKVKFDVDDQVRGHL
ncbi:radical SAM protein [candidate division KSB1 bacterium]|nr:radical SAM protein [candidate division KSB1 bacterium]